MTKRILGVAAVLVVFFGAATGSTAAVRTQLPAMLAVSEAHLGPNSCGAAMRIEWVGHHALDGPDVPGKHVVGRGRDCKIQLDAVWFNSASWIYACTIAGHEYGHAVLGLPHSNDPNSIMAVPPLPYTPCGEAEPLDPETEESWFGRTWEKAERLEARAVSLRGKARRAKTPRRKRVLRRKARALERRAARLYGMGLRSTD